MKRTALVVAPREDGAFLAVSRPNPPLRFGFPGGGVERGETPAEGAMRELWEETGLVSSELIPLCAEDRRPGHRVYWFYSPSVHGQLRSSHEGHAVWVEPAVLACPEAAFPEPTRRVFDLLGIFWRHSR